MYFMYKIIEAAGGKEINGDAAVKSVLGISFESPRGKITMGPNRDLIQNFYVRRVEKAADGRKRNVVVKTFEQVQPPIVPRS
jgi:branched-chain amino acid transport system substrate-binding protein